VSGACRLAAGVVGAWLALSPAAFAEVVDIDWSARGRFERSLSVPPGKFVEVCGKLAKGARVRWQYAAGAALDFNVHYHSGKDVIYPAKRDATAKASGTLDVAVEQDYCWMWANKSVGEAKLRLQLSR
jgi:hypothetical protein